MESSTLNWNFPTYTWCTKNLKFGSNCYFGRRLRTRRSCFVSMKSGSLPSRELPWLTLPPVFEGGDMVYRFYKLENGQVVSIPKKPKGVELNLDQVPPDDAKLVGSSHGWLASFDEHTKHVYLSNPISHHHIKLPPTNTLPDPDLNLFEGISRVILTGCPSENWSYAITTFGPGRRLACCQPTLSTRWTPMGNAFQAIEEDPEPFPIDDHVKFAEPPKEDFVFCGGRRLTSISTFELNLDCYFYAGHTPNDLIDDPQGSYTFMWDCDLLDDPAQLKKCTIDRATNDDGRTICEGDGGEHFLEMLKKECIQMPHLLYADGFWQEPLILLRIVNRGIGYNGSSADQRFARHDLYRERIHTFPYKTVSFLVISTDRDECNVVKDLKGLALFVGMNHSFAIPAADSRGILKPNSIYFTDACRINPSDPKARKIYGGHDIGIFDYESKTISPCCNFPCDFQSFQRIDPPPMWFTPSPISDSWF